MSRLIDGVFGSIPTASDRSSSAAFRKGFQTSIQDGFEKASGASPSSVEPWLTLKLVDSSPLYLPLLTLD